ncbi:MAG: IS110 family transposase [Parachlamydiaceae bacterium]|nr:IS110 family transposase [Parachlamydiaceae bacterium]
MQVVNPHAAGIDVGSKSHWVAVDQLHQHVREFGVYTKDHKELIEYLRAHQVTTVAMESTGSYWQTLFNALQKAGFEVFLVRGSNTKNVKGKKTDVLDCMWIQKLHSLGLLTASFILSDYLQHLRTYYDHRSHLIEQTTKYINKMQKALRLMNVRLDVAISDITGKSGRLMLDAILEGKRDPKFLASLADGRIKKSKEEIEASLQGQWRDDLLFELRSCLKFYDNYLREINDCDQKIEQLLHQYIPSRESLEFEQTPTSKANGKIRAKFAPSFNVRQLAFTHLKTDLFQIPGVSFTTVLSLLCNMGMDIKRFSSAKQFASWLRLVPDNKVSGGKTISSRTPKGKSTVANSLRLAANSIGNQKDHPLTPFFKRIAYRKGRSAAITATARKLAVIIWNMIIKSEPYRGYDYETINQKRKNAQIKNIRARLAKLKLSEDEIENLFQRTTIHSSYTLPIKPLKNP